MPIVKCILGCFLCDMVICLLYHPSDDKPFLFAANIFFCIFVSKRNLYPERKKAPLLSKQSWGMLNAVVLQKKQSTSLLFWYIIYYKNSRSQIYAQTPEDSLTIRRPCDIIQSKSAVIAQYQIKRADQESAVQTTPNFLHIFLFFYLLHTLYFWNFRIIFYYLFNLIDY